MFFLPLQENFQLLNPPLAMQQIPSITTYQNVSNYPVTYFPGFQQRKLHVPLPRPVPLTSSRQYLRCNLYVREGVALPLVRFSLSITNHHAIPPLATQNDAAFQQELSICLF